MPDDTSSQNLATPDDGRYIGLSEVASRAGISRSAVSMALRNNTRIPKETRERVIRIADELGYRPNPLLSRMVGMKRNQSRSSSGMPIAMITFGHPYTSGFDVAGVSYACEYGKKHGYIIQHFHLPEHKGPTQLSRLLYNRGIEAVLIDSCLHPTFAEEFDWTHFSAVAISSGYYDQPVNHIDVDAFADMQVIWQKAREVGARRIGVVFYREQIIPRDRNLRLASLQHSLRMDPLVLDLSCLEMQGNELTSLRAWLNACNPDVVIGFSPAVYWWLAEVGWIVDRNHRFICTSMTQQTSLTTDSGHRTLAGLIKGDEKMIHSAIDQLDLQIRRFERGVAQIRKRILIASDWCAGSSLYPEQ